MPIQSWIHGLREKYGQSGNFIIPLHLVPEHPQPVSWKAGIGRVSSALHYDVVAERFTLKKGGKKIAEFTCVTLQTPHGEM